MSSYEKAGVGGGEIYLAVPVSCPSNLISFLLSTAPADGKHLRLDSRAGEGGGWGGTRLMRLQDVVRETLDSFRR